MVSQTQKLNASTGFASFLKSKWRSRDERPSRPQTINAMTDVERDYVRHSALKLALDGDFQAPIHQLLKSGGSEILDIGCGAGFWTTDMAAKYPISHFTGIDIDKDIFPTSGVTRNVIFQRVDLLELPLPYENDTFDYIFIRCMMDVVPDQDWDDVLNELVRIMKKGGYIECLETYPDLFDTGPAMSTIMQLVVNGDKSSPDEPASMVLNPLPNRMAAINQLMGMQIKHLHTPVGRYGGAMGALLLEHWVRIIESSKQKWIQNKLIGEKQLAATLEELQQEVDVYQTYMSWYSVVAQKKGYKGPIIRVEDYDTLQLQE
ncbi:S-adenosyl-L-methionine-dependent methyltransferase [Lichtheimia hyalospora FSU 10163]|nr:S-adenosyl-L-methionine-dependent methyltransferase [Lichtheimia hyalospora FSU 10163]